MSVYVLADAADPTITWALELAQAVEESKAANRAAAAARRRVNALLAAKPS